jgi:hypothetical protein
MAGTCSLPSACAAPCTSCAGSCVDVLADDENCGGCGIDCGSELCCAGICSPTCPSPIAPAC